MRNDDLNLFFKRVSFRRDSDGFFVGQGQNNKRGQFKIAIFEQNIACFQEDEILFQIPLGVDLGTFLVLAQEFGIIHERFIYERVEIIEDEYLEYEEDDYDEESFFDIDDEEDEKHKQLLQVKNSKFMELLKKGKKKQN